MAVLLIFLVRICVFSEQTRDVDATITNILEGRVNLQQKQTPVQPPSLQKEVSSLFCRH